MDLTDPEIRRFWKRLASIVVAKGGHIEQHFDQRFKYGRYVIEIFSIWYTRCRQRNEMAHIYAPPCIYKIYCAWKTADAD